MSQIPSAMQGSPTKETLVRGLDNLVIDTTNVGWIDGDKGVLYYRGINIVELTAHSSFEETAYLLMCGKLPTARQLQAFAWKSRQMTHPQEKILRIIQELPQTTQPLFALQTALAALACIETGLQTFENEGLLETSMRIVAQTPVILAAAYRHALGVPIISPRDDLNHAENFLYMLTGRIPSKRFARYIELALILQMDNGFTSSTFTARTVASTLTNIHSATSAAVASLTGPLVGGACQEVDDMLADLRATHDVEGWLLPRLERGEAIAGIGHRVYKVADPRANILENILRELTPPEKKRGTDLDLLEQVLAACQRWGAPRGISFFPNVDFWAGAVYSRFGLLPMAFPAITAAARVVGWTSHIMELRGDNCLYRPRSLYTGPINVPYVPMEDRLGGRASPA